MSEVPPALANCRAAIDAIDARLVALLAERFAVVDEVVRVKRAAGIAAHLSDRIDEVVEKVGGEAEAMGLPRATVETLWRCLIDLTIQYETERLAGPGR